jgi:hypothetical protein
MQALVFAEKAGETKCPGLPGDDQPFRQSYPQRQARIGYILRECGGSVDFDTQ